MPVNTAANPDSPSAERRARRAIACAIAAAILPSTLAAAQPARGPQIDLDRTERTFERLQRDQRRSRGDDIVVPTASRPDTVSDRRPLFSLAGVRVEGAHSFARDAIAATYQAHIGRTVSPADLAEIAGRITDLYRQHGYHLSRAVIPPQDAAGGVVRIDVIEGRITEVVVKGARADGFNVRGLLDPLAAESPARSRTLERRLLLVNDLPGVRIADTAIEEIGTTTGRFRLIVEVETWQNYLSLSIDNRGTDAVGRLQSFVATNLNSLVVGGDTLGVNVSTVPDDPRELAFGRLSYNLPSGVDGARLGITASTSQVRPGDERRDIDTRDRASVFELRGSIVPLRGRHGSLWLSGAATIGEYSEKDVFGRVYEDNLRIASLTADYQTHDALDGWNYWTATVRQGLGILGASSKGDRFRSRIDGSGDFTKFELYYTRYQKLSDIWSLKMSMAGQLASTPLLASQEFYLGASFGRGYFGADFSGDHALAGSLELRFDQKTSHEVLKGYQLYGYADHTTAWNFHSEGRPLSLTLAGAGARLYLADDVQVAIEAAMPVEYRTPEPQARRPRAFFGITKSIKFCPGSQFMRCS